MGGVKTKICAKLGENRTNGSGVIQVFANFNMAAGGHLGLLILTFWGHRLLPGSKWMIHTKFGAYKDVPFQSYSIFSKFLFFVGGHLGF